MRLAEVRMGERVILPRCEITTNAWERMRGLLPKAGLAEGEALYIAPCTSVHTLFMRFTIDLAFLDSAGRVVALYDSLKPWRLSWIHFKAKGVIEAPAGTFARAGVQKGAVLTLCPST